MSLRQEAKIKELERRVDEQEEVIDILSKRVDELEERRKPGRPKKVADG